MSATEPGVSMRFCGYSGCGPCFFGSAGAGACGDAVLDIDELLGVRAAHRTRREIGCKGAATRSGPAVNATAEPIRAILRPLNAPPGLRAVAARDCRGGV